MWRCCCYVCYIFLPYTRYIYTHGTLTSIDCHVFLLADSLRSNARIKFNGKYSVTASLLVVCAAACCGIILRTHETRKKTFQMKILPKRDLPPLSVTRITTVGWAFLPGCPGFETKRVDHRTAVYDTDGPKSAHRKGECSKDYPGLGNRSIHYPYFIGKFFTLDPRRGRRFETHVDRFFYRNAWVRLRPSAKNQLPGSRALKRTG